MNQQQATKKEALQQYHHLKVELRFAAVQVNMSNVFQINDLWSDKTKIELIGPNNKK